VTICTAWIPKLLQRHQINISCSWVVRGHALKHDQQGKEGSGVRRGTQLDDSVGQLRYTDRQGLLHALKLHAPPAKKESALSDSSEVCADE
jgi:hypothetical protein